MPGRYNLGNACKQQGKLDEAVACYRRALQLEPDFAGAHSNLGNALKDQGNLDEAIACYRRAVETESPISFRLTATSSTRFIFFDCRTMQARSTRSSAAGTGGTPTRWRSSSGLTTTSARPSAGCGRLCFARFPHPSRGRFLLPLLQAHDRRQFEIFCYASRPSPTRSPPLAAPRPTRGASPLADEQLAEVIRDDRIDILVDLTMHMADNRLLVFARKPAPVQVTYLAYCGTTGLSAIDYRLTDPYLDPPDEPQTFLQRAVALAAGDVLVLSSRSSPTPPLNRLPALQAGHVTFGCLNNFCKVTAATLAAWSRLLTDRARIALAPSRRGRRPPRPAARFLPRQGVAPRAANVGRHGAAGRLFRFISRSTWRLDPFPYGGGTTTCDALWMGVPVVSLAGRTAVGRGGLSILSNLGLTELVAHDDQQ